MGSKKKDLTNLKFGRLEVIKLSSTRKYGNSTKRMWLCKCDCGKEIEVNTGALNSGNTKSCGCLHDELSADIGRNSRHKVANSDAGYKSIMRSYIQNAKDREYEFLLTFDEFKNIITSDCYYCGTPPSNTYFKNYYNIKYNGVDRKNNDVGYNVENSVACCKMCNIAKNNNSYDDFISWVIRIFRKTASKVVQSNIEITGLVKTYSNDATLGEQIRKLIR